MNICSAAERILPVCAAAALVIGLSCVQDSANAAMEGVEFVQIGGKAGWPILLPDGRLMMWWIEGKGEAAEEVNNPDLPQKCFARFSSDSGQSWTEPQLLFQFAPQKGSFLGPGGILCDRDGVIHCFGLRFFAWAPDDWENARSFLFHIMSADGGKTWTPPQDCDFGALYTGASNCAIQLNSGRILAPISYLSKRKTARFVSRITLSDDRGKTWRPSEGECVVDTGGGAGESGACEPVCLQLNDGRVWMLIRTQGGYQYESFSSDDGDTWTEAVPSRFVSSNAPVHMTRLRDGRIALVWQNCMGPSEVSYDRQILAAAISDDDGQTWHGYREIVRAGERGASGQVAYPWIAEAADGKLLVAYFGVKGPWDVGILRLDAAWLYEAALQENFTRGLENWVTMGTEGAATVPHSGRAHRQVLALRKPKPDVPTGASMNFPFGAQGHLTMRMRLEPGFQGARICLTDHFSLPGIPEDGVFGLSLSPTGKLSVGMGGGSYEPTDVTLEVGKWHTLGLLWDCPNGYCGVTVDYQRVGDLKQLTRAAGLCYLRLWSGPETDEAGMLVESVSTRATAW